MTLKRYTKNFIFATILILAAVLTIPFASAKAEAAGWDGTASETLSGDGTENLPYIINSAEDLAYLAAEVNGGNDFSGKFISVTADEIDLNNRQLSIGYANDSSETLDLKPFNGTFNGNGVTVKNLSVAVSEEEGIPSYYGLFGYIGQSGKVSSVNLDTATAVVTENASPDVTEEYYFGGIAGVNEGNIIFCTVKNVTAENFYYVGGICGNNNVISDETSFGTITECTVSDITVTGCERFAGVAVSNYGKIDGCTAVGKFSSDGGSFGGIVCDNGTAGEIIYSSFFGSTDSLIAVTSGGLAAVNYGKITVSYVHATLAASETVGGISANNSGEIASCYFYGTVSGTTAGGVTARNNGKITDCAAIGKSEFIATDVAGGISAENSGEINNVFVSANLTAERAVIINDGTVNGYYDKAGYAGQTSGNGFSIDDFSTVALGDGFVTASGYYPFVKEIYGHSSGFGYDMRQAFAISACAEVTVGDEKLYQRFGLKTDLPAPSKVGYTFNGWSDGTNLYNGKNDFTSDTVLTAVYKLNDVEFISVSGNVAKIYDGVPYVVTAEFNFPLTLSYEWYRSENGEEGTFEKVDKLTGNEVSLKNATESGVYYCRAYFTDGKDITEAESTKVVVDILKVSYDGITYPYDGGNAIDGGKYSQKTLSEYPLSDGFFWSDGSTVPTVDKTGYAAFYNADPDNYNDFAITINLTLQKGDYNGITYDYGENNYIYGGRYSKKTLDSIELADGFKWQDGSVVFDVGENIYSAYYNADSTNYNDYPLTLTVKTDKGLYSGVTHPVLYGRYKETSTLSDYELEDNFYWLDSSVVPTVAVTEYAAYYNADKVRYENYNLTITINVDYAASTVNPVISDEILYVGGEFPTITLSEGDTAGVISWDEATLTDGEKLYYWTFVPTNENYSAVRRAVTLTVYIKYLVSVEVTSLPKKTTYNALETFVRDGMVITATFSGGKKEIVENFDLIYPTESDKFVFGDEKITVIYVYEEISKTVSVPVTVIKNVISTPADDNEYRYDGNAQKSLMQNTALYTVESDEGTLPGSYNVKFILIDKNNYAFEDGSSEVTAKWTILPALVTVPQIDKEFVYNGQEQYSGIPESSYYEILNGQARTDAGTYEITLRLVNSNLYNWRGLDGEKAVEDVTVKWTIKVKYVSDPEIVTEEYVYNGRFIRFAYKIYDGTVADYDGAIRAGEYEVTFTLKNKNYAWSYDEARPTRTLSFTIKPKAVTVPTIDEKFVYSGTEYTLNVSDTDEYTVTDKTGTNAGMYFVKFTLKSADYVWADGTKDIKSVQWRIARKSVAKPVKEDVVLTYNGEYTDLPLTASADCVISGNRQRNAGNYVAVAALRDKNNFMWSDETTDDISINWSIAKKEIDLPITAGNYVYTGETLTASLNVSEVNVVGNVGINAGRYEMTVSLLDENNYVWKDGSSAPKTVQWQISKMKIEKPQKIDDGTYNGLEQTARISGGKYLTLGGNVAKNAGKYAVTAALTDKNNCEWTDGSTTDITLEWVINKAEIEVPKESSALIYSGAEQKANIAETSLYTLSGNFATADGEYEATATLVDANNYKFVGTDETAVKIKFHVYAVKLSVDGEEKKTDYIAGATLPVPTKDGYNFAGWYLDSECETERVERIDDLTSDAVLYAKWIKDGLPDDIKPNDNGSSAKLSVKAIAGIAVGGVCGLIAIALIIYVATRQKSNRFRD